MRRTFNNVISVLYSGLRFSFIKLFHGNNFQFFPLQRFSPNVVFEMNRKSQVTLGKKIRVHSGCKIKIRQGASLCIGSNVCMNYNCMIVCHRSISIGAGTEFGPFVCLFDHDHQYSTHGVKKSQFVSADINIGKNCWIGANTIILRGTTIGDNCVIGAGCILKGKYEANSRIVQKRDTAIENNIYG